MNKVSKEYFACKCIEQINGCRYLYKRQITGIVSAVKHKFQITVDKLTDDELESYVANMIEQTLFAKTV